MAFARGFRGRFTNRRRAAPRGKVKSWQLPKSVAKKRRQWVTIWNEMELCQYNCLPWESESCSFNFQLVLIEPSSLGELFEYEPVTIVRQVGSVMLRPWRARGNPCDPASFLGYSNWLRNHFHLRAGLIKQRTSNFEPSGTFYDPSNSDDWSESPWRRMWEHQWLPRTATYGTQYQNGNTVIGVCSNTQAAGAGPATNTLSSGSGVVNIPAITTQCTPFLLPEGCGTLPYIEAAEFPFWRLSLNSRKRIYFSESDRMDIWASMHAITANSETCGVGVDCFNDLNSEFPCNITAYTNYKILVEYG